jgi:hypothetical protein
MEIEENLGNYLKVILENQKLKLLYSQFTGSNNAAEVPFSSFNIGKNYQ